MHNPYAAQANTERNEMEQSKLDEIIRKQVLRAIHLRAKK